MKKLNTERLLKVYKVTYASFEKGEDYLNVDSSNVLAENAAQAMSKENHADDDTGIAGRRAWCPPRTYARSLGIAE